MIGATSQEEFEWIGKTVAAGMQIKSQLRPVMLGAMPVINKAGVIAD